MSGLNQVLSALGVKGATATYAGSSDYLIKTDADGRIDITLLPFDASAHYVSIYYVDPIIGDDVRGYGTELLPYATISKAVAANAADGGTPMVIYLAPATYPGFTVSNDNQTRLQLVGIGAGVVVGDITMTNSVLAPDTMTVILRDVTIGAANLTTPGKDLNVIMYDGTIASGVASASAGVLVRYSGTGVGSIVNLTEVFAALASEVAYAPTTPTDWLVAPELVSEGLDELAGRMTLAEGDIGDLQNDKADKITVIGTAADSGLAGGGDLSGDRDLVLNLNGLTDKPTPVATDVVVIQEAGGTLMKVDVTNLPGADGTLPTKDYLLDADKIIIKDSENSFNKAEVEYGVLKADMRLQAIIFG